MRSAAINLKFTAHVLRVDKKKPPARQEVFLFKQNIQKLRFSAFYPLKAVFVLVYP